MLEFQHVDVFANKPLSGNGVTVVYDDNQILTTEQMQAITQEFKQIETIFLTFKSDKEYYARIFTVEEELGFAGHPILGAAACVHSRYFKEEKIFTLKILLQSKTVLVTSERKNNYYYVEMDQGRPEFIDTLKKTDTEKILQRLSLTLDNKAETLPLEVVSTGLPYLLIPLKSGLENVQIITNDLSEILRYYKAKFTYVFDVNTLEGRSFDNEGKVEDVATGSAAGPLCAYLIKHGLKEKNKDVEIHQGKYVGRPSTILAKYTTDNNDSIIVGGAVAFFGSGTFEIS